MINKSERSRSFQSILNFAFKSIEIGNTDFEYCQCLRKNFELKITTMMQKVDLFGKILSKFHAKLA